MARARGQVLKKHFGFWIFKYENDFLKTNLEIKLNFLENGFIV